MSGFWRSFSQTLGREARRSMQGVGLLLLIVVAVALLSGCGPAATTSVTTTPSPSTTVAPVEPIAGGASPTSDPEPSEARTGVTHYLPEGALEPTEAKTAVERTVQP